MEEPRCSDSDQPPSVAKPPTFWGRLLAGLAPLFESLSYAQSDENWEWLLPLAPPEAAPAALEPTLVSEPPHVRRHNLRIVRRGPEPRQSASLPK